MVMWLFRGTGTAGIPDFTLGCSCNHLARVIDRLRPLSSFANTDLDYQLRQRDITHVICAGMVANTCLEATARYALELSVNDKSSISLQCNVGLTIKLGLQGLPRHHDVGISFNSNRPSEAQ